jgi:hypothetical protein
VLPPSTDPWDGDMPKQFSFPQGDSYVLVVDSNMPHGFKWVWIDGPQTQTDAINAGSISPTVVGLAAGHDADDAMWERYPVANGPHRRP